MESNVSRQPFMVGLAPEQWVCVLQDQEGVPPADGRTVRDYYHGVTLRVEADPQNALSTEIAVQDSDDGGTTWTTRYHHPTALVPGGQISIDTVHVQARMRVLAYSAGQGVIKAYLLPPEAQASPDYLRQATLTCSAYCEVACETGDEVTPGD